MNHHRQQTIFFFSCKASKYAIERNRTAYVRSHPTFDRDIYTHRVDFVGIKKRAMQAKFISKAKSQMKLKKKLHFLNVARFARGTFTTIFAHRGPD